MQFAGLYGELPLQGYSRTEFLPPAIFRNRFVDNRWKHLRITLKETGSPLPVSSLFSVSDCASSAFFLLGQHQVIADCLPLNLGSYVDGSAYGSPALASDMDDCPSADHPATLRRFF